MTAGPGSLPGQPVPHHPFRFTVQCHGPADASGWVELARKAEDLGYSALTVPDHLDDALGPVASLVAAATATTTIRVGVLVFSNDYRHPVVLAKEAATLDLLTDGRLDLGLGAGWKTTDYAASGIALEPPAARIDRLVEAIPIIKGLLAGETVHHEGEHYQVRGLAGTPRAVQRPHPPILIGGGGRRVLTLAARHADMVGLNIALPGGRIDESAGPTATAASTDQKLAWIREAAGDRFADLELHTRIHLAMVHDDRNAIADAFGPAFGMTPDESKDSPHALVGTLDELVQQCHERRDRWGISAIGISDDAMDAFAPLVARLTGT
jgi:probable F420-dependent oxidoreductase